MNKDLKTIGDELVKKEGNIKGEVIRVYGEIIKDKGGEEALKKVEERLKEIGHPVKFDEIKSMSWYKEGLSALILLTLKDVLGWTDDDIYEIGWYAPRKSFIFKMLMNYFVSIESVYENAPKYWRKHFDFGELEKVKFSKEEKLAMIKVKDYDFHPVICNYWRGYFASVVKLSVSESEISVTETECVYKGGEAHQFKIRWGSTK